MVDFSSLAEVKHKSENKGLIQARWLSPHLCGRSLPTACLQPRHHVGGSSLAQLSALGRWAISAGEPASEARARWPVSCQPAWGQDLSQCSGFGRVICTWLGTAGRLSVRSMVLVCTSRTPLWVLEMGREAEITSCPGWASDVLCGEGHGQSA